jgi:DNA-binding IclR family transcriptional regulator
MLPIEKALEILELLAARPDGLAVADIIAHFRMPASQVIRTIVVMQQRRWLRTLPGDRLTIGHRILEVTAGRQLS